jgi:hypothetical protein
VITFILGDFYDYTLNKKKVLSSLQYKFLQSLTFLRFKIDFLINVYIEIKGIKKITPSSSTVYLYSILYKIYYNIIKLCTILASICI